MLIPIIAQTPDVSGLVNAGTENLSQIGQQNPILSYLLVVLSLMIIALAWVLHKKEQKHCKTIEAKDKQIQELNKMMTQNAVENLKTMKDYEGNFDKVAQALMIMREKNDNLEESIKESLKNTNFLEKWVRERYLKN